MCHCSEESSCRSRRREILSHNEEQLQNNDAEAEINVTIFLLPKARTIKEKHQRPEKTLSKHETVSSER